MARVSSALLGVGYTDRTEFPLPALGKALLVFSSSRKTRRTRINLFSVRCEFLATTPYRPLPAGRTLRRAISRGTSALGRHSVRGRKCRSEQSCSAERDPSERGRPEPSSFSGCTGPEEGRASLSGGKDRCQLRTPGAGQSIPPKECDKERRKKGSPLPIWPRGK